MLSGPTFLPSYSIAAYISKPIKTSCGSCSGCAVQQVLQLSTHMTQVARSCTFFQA